MKYKHGGNIRKVAETYGIDEASIIDFSANINPLGISSKTREAISGAIDSIVNYPDTESCRLISALSKYHEIKADCILTGSGATELIYLIPRVLRPKKALVIAPAFSEYEGALFSAGCKVDHFILSHEDAFQLNMDALFKTMEKGYDTLWLGNPANPTGRLIKKKELLRIAEKSTDLGMTLIVDEAFIDFCEEESVKMEVMNFPDLIVLRSMTKFYALPGLRVGYLFAHKSLIEKIKKFKEPWTVNCLGEAAAIASLEDPLYREATVKFITEERKFLTHEVSKLSAFKVFPTPANYLLLKINNNLASSRIQDKLIKDHGILIRDCSNYAGLDESFIRVAVKGRDENRRLINAFFRF
ncbi:MAG: threonine-phosphate decarboxylase CobD [Deltaproteobacteria bacterium]|nr:threonine-phosphate decarboxylase CobD [Deltaproteobacteria bacterium]